MHVPAASLDNYAATEPWSGFGTIVPIISSMTLADGGVYTNDTDTDYDEISYTRNFSNTNWQALYVPFEMSYDDWKDDFEVARINNMHQWDDDDDGVIDRTALEIIKVKKGTISANTPYMIKAMTPGEKTIVVMDATLYAAEENSIDCSSTSATYTFTGTYSGIPGSEMVDNGYYAMGGGLLRQAAGVENNLSPMRWYLAVTDRDGHPAQFGEVKVMVFGEDETDGVEVIQNSKCKIQNYFDLSGRRTEKPRKGIYIKNGKKYVIK